MAKKAKKSKKAKGAKKGAKRTKGKFGPNPAGTKQYIANMRKSFKAMAPVIERNDPKFYASVVG